jgi:uncharacterized protein YjbI with pentapeptide repeats
VQRFRWQQLLLTACATFAVSALPCALAPPLWFAEVAHADDSLPNPSTSTDLPPIEKLKLQLQQRSPSPATPEATSQETSTPFTSPVPSPQTIPALSAEKPQSHRANLPLLLFMGGGAVGVIAIGVTLTKRRGDRSSELDWHERQEDISDSVQVPEISVDESPEAKEQLPPFALSDGLQFLLSGDLNGWNQWREVHPNQKLDLSKIDLSGRSLPGVNLSRVDLSASNLDRTDLSSADLSYANLNSARLQGAKLTSAKLAFADCRRASLQGADLSFADLTYATLNEANLISAQLKSANLSHARLINANLSHAFAKWAILRSTVMTQAIAQHANFEVSLMIGVGLQRADLSHADFRRALLHRAKTEGTNFTQADFLGAQIENWQCDQWTNFSGTVLAEDATQVLPAAPAMAQSADWILSQVGVMKYPVINHKAA